MSTKQRRKAQRSNRLHRRTRDWTRLYHEGLLDAPAEAAARPRTIVWSPPRG